MIFKNKAMTYLFLIGFKAHSIHEMEPILDTTKMAKNLRLERSWDYGKPNTFIILNEYRSKAILMTS